MRKSFLLFVAAFLLNLSVYADKQYEVNGLLYSITSDNSVEVSGLSDTEIKDIVIPSSIYIDAKKYSVKSIGIVAFQRLKLSSITIPSSITQIGRDVFDYSSLTKVVIQDSDNPIVIDQNHDNTFPYNLDSVYIGRDIEIINGSKYNNVFKNVKGVEIGGCVRHINSHVFLTSDLIHVTIHEGLTEISDELFYNARNLKQIQLPSTITRIGDYAFYGTSISEIVFPDRVKHIGYNAFSEIRSLRSIVLSESVDTIESRAFYNCRSLKNISIPGSVNYIGMSAFQNCDSLINVVYHGSMQKICKQTFCNCQSLQNIVLPSGLEEIEEYAFNDCFALQSFEYPNSIRVIHSNALTGCYGIKKLVYNENVEEIDNVGYPPYYSKCYLDTIIVNFKTPIPVTKTWSSNIIVVVPHGCGSDFRNADYWKSNIIQEVDEDYVSVNLEQPGTLYTEISKSVSPAKVGKLKITGELGENDWKILKSDKTPMLYSLDLSGISNTEIPKSQFSGKTWLTDIVLPDSIEKINNNSFYGCTRLTGTLNLPESFKTFGEYSMYGTNYDSIVFTNDVSVMSHAFDNCTSLKHISSEYISSIGSQAFSGCKSLERFSTSDKLKTISAFAFNNCSGLSEIVLNEGLEVINENVFQNCSSLKEIAFPFSLKSIAYQVFSGCINMTDFYAPWNSPIRFVFCSYGDEIDLEKATLHVPAGTEGSYAVADGWWHFKNIVSYDPTNVPVYYDDNKKTNTYYDIYGRILNSGSTDQIYIHNGHKYIEMKVF